MASRDRDRPGAGSARRARARHQRRVRQVPDARHRRAERPVARLRPGSRSPRHDAHRRGRPHRAHPRYPLALRRAAGRRLPAAGSPGARPAPAARRHRLLGAAGRPGDLFTAGRLAEPLDAYARAHDGRAPIVVSVDQLSAPGKNTMCVDSRLGNVATYVMHDVPTWIERHLPATTDRKAWGLTGFSQGGTCTMQFLTGHPSEFARAGRVERAPADRPGPAAQRRPGVRRIRGGMAGGGADRADAENGLDDTPSG